MWGATVLQRAPGGSDSGPRGSVKVTQISTNQVAAASAWGQRQGGSLKELGVAGQRGQLFSRRGLCPESQPESCFPPSERPGQVCRSKNCLPALVGMAALSTGADCWGAAPGFLRAASCVSSMTHLRLFLDEAQVAFVTAGGAAIRQDDLPALRLPSSSWILDAGQGHRL